MAGPIQLKAVLVAAEHIHTQDPMTAAMTEPPPHAWTSRTLAAQAMGTIEPVTGAVVSPLHLSTTYLRDPDNRYRAGYCYGRPDNATVRQAETVIAALEQASAAALFGSGMAAATALVLALPAGSHIVASQVMYWAFRNWLSVEAMRFGYRLTLVDTSDLAAVRAAVGTDTALVYVETPGNPLWTISDIAAIARIAHAQGALLAIDSTVATPVFTRPLALGADIVMHSASKYLNGHSDVIAGALACATRNDLWERVLAMRAQHGAILGPFEAWLLLRGLRTLDVRLRCQSLSAALIADRLVAHPAVARVLYPGLPGHPGHAVAARQMTGGFGAMLSIRVHGGARAAIASAAAVTLWKRATSLGGVESLIEHRASAEGANSPCPDDLLRLSVGLEDPADLLADLEGALTAAQGSAP
jgi:cystathionine gamma-synthase